MPKTTEFPPKAPKTEQPWTPKEVYGGYVTPDKLYSELLPYAKSADVMQKAASITGYDATKEQTLQHDATGSLKWVDNASAD